MCFYSPSRTSFTGNPAWSTSFQLPSQTPPDRTPFLSAFAHLELFSARAADAAATVTRPQCGHRSWKSIPERRSMALGGHAVPVATVPRRNGLKPNICQQTLSTLSDKAATDGKASARNRQRVAVAAVAIASTRQEYCSSLSYPRCRPETSKEKKEQLLLSILKSTCFQIHQKISKCLT